MPVDERESLVGKRICDRRRDLQIREQCVLHARDARTDAIDESLGQLVAQPAGREVPGLDQHMIAGDQLAGELPQPVGRPNVTRVAGIRRGVPRGCVGEDAHAFTLARRDPRLAMAVFPSFTTSLPPESPIPMIASGDACGAASSRSRATS
ncbi:MAG: hypothetical protein U5R31_03855 [Acidimicrobiia bacterium]|nr:hypothetical protein [Acidimicrobiia bacterium]